MAATNKHSKQTDAPPTSVGGGLNISDAVPRNFGGPATLHQPQRRFLNNWAC